MKVFVVALFLASIGLILYGGWEGMNAGDSYVGSRLIIFGGIGVVVGVAIVALRDVRG